MQKLNTNQTKYNNLKTAKQNCPGSVASYDTLPGNEVGLFYNDNTHGPRNPRGELKFVKICKKIFSVLFYM